MGAYLYDEALLQKVKGWTVNSQIQVYGTDETKRLFEVTADNSNDKPIQLPIITIDRPGGYTVINPTKKPMTFDGATLKADMKKALQLNAIPITLKYQIDIYARYFKEADLFARDLVFNFINHPKLDVHIPYKEEDVVHTANLILDNDVADNSSVPQQLSIGQFTRLSLNLTLDEAFLWDVRIRDVISILDCCNEE